MARRRRRIKIKIKSLTLFALVLLSFHLTSGAPNQHHYSYDFFHNHHHLNYHSNPNQNLNQLEQQDVARSSSQQHSIAQQQHQQQQQQQHKGSSAAHLCSTLPAHLSKHLKLCKLIGQSAGADEAVAMGAAKGLAECRSQLKWERWNCSHAHGDHHLLTGELAQSLGYKESGFVQAIAAAGIVQAVATACSVGSLTDCACDKTRIGSIRRQDENWKWGGCSNNIRHGMLFAKHLVELLDAVHQHSRAQLRSLGKRSLSSRHREPNLVRSEAGGQAGGGSLPVAFCQQTHNISQLTHQRLIKSLLSRNSLEKHQELRQVMNLHNNKVGRMAIAKNMELRCRCHGLSGSCSLKTCWLTLSPFQVTGAYLKRKYQDSVHLPSTVNLNKLIYMMDRNEISAILSDSVTAPETAPEPAPEPAALVSPQRLHLGASQLVPLGVQLPSGNTSQPDTHLSLYERHKHLQAAAGLTQPPTPTSDEIPVNLAPMTQQQYQALLRDMKLCNTSAIASSAPSTPTASFLTTRDLSHQASNAGHDEHQLAGLKQVRGKKAREHQLTHQLAAQHLKSANQHLGQLLQSNKDELIHLHKSPDYCEPDPRHGFGGIQSRVCSDNPLAPDNCDKLCCGRGYRSHTYQHSYKCDCKFKYCCSIKCSDCEKEIKVLLCN